MSDEEKEEVIPSNLILYLGEDLSFYSLLESKYKKIYPSSAAVFTKIERKGDSEVQSLILEIRRLRPKLIFIDYSTHTESMLHITRVWLRQNFYRNVAFIGLWDYNKNDINLKRSIMTNMKCVHIKSSEFEAICFDIQVLAFPDDVEDHGFATAKLTQPFKIFIPAKLIRITPNGFQIESNIDLSSTTEINLESFLIDDEVLYSPLSKVFKQDSENLYYNYDYTQYVRPIFDIEVLKTDDMSNEEFTQLQQQNREQSAASKIKLEKWIQDNKEKSSPKFIKTLIIDKSDALFNNRPMSDSFKTVFRTQAYLKEIKIELLKTKPHIIVFHLEKQPKEDLHVEGEEDIAYSYNTGAVLLKIIQVIQNRDDGYQPYIIVFNTIDKTTEMVQETFKYQNIIAVKERIDIDIVVQMCDLLRAKIEPAMIKQQHATNSVYFQKNDPRTYVEVQGEITVKSCSESDIYFDTTDVIPEGTVFRMNINKNIYVTVMPMPAFAKAEAAYFGIIHGIGEIERQGLRQFINNIFFQDLQAKKAEEAQAIEDQKKKFIEDKEAEEQRKIEEQQAKEEAEAEEKRKQEEEEALKSAETQSQEEEK